MYFKRKLRIFIIRESIFTKGRKTMKNIIINKKILENNDNIAKRNRDAFELNKVFTINLLGSPGCGKTTFLEGIIDKSKINSNISVIEGDLYTTKDAKRIEDKGVDVIQLNTSGACHLDAGMIEKALLEIDIEKIDLLVIENVGNLVCPSEFDLGEDIKVTIMSIAEGNDKPLKYPAIFQKSSVVILNKMDMIDLTNFNLDEFYRDIYSINKDVKVFEVSSINKKGLDEVMDYFINEINEKKMMCFYEE